LARFEFESEKVSFHFTFIFVSWLENHVCLSRGVQVAGAAWCAVMRIRNGRTGRVLSGWVIERYSAYGDDERGFLG
jgi:hypothetical protein